MSLLAELGGGGGKAIADHDRSYVNVRRSQLWVDSCRFLQRKSSTHFQRYLFTLPMTRAQVKVLLMLETPGVST